MLTMADVTLTDQNFQAHVLDNKSLVLVDFWAPWCPPCKVIDPIMHDLVKEYDGKMLLGKVNSDENQAVVDQCNVMSLPTVILFKNGQPVKTLVGAQDKQTYKRAIEEALV